MIYIGDTRRADDITRECAVRYTLIFKYETRARVDERVNDERHDERGVSELSGVGRAPRTTLKPGAKRPVNYGTNDIQKHLSICNIPLDRAIVYRIQVSGTRIEMGGQGSAGTRARPGV